MITRRAWNRFSNLNGAKRGLIIPFSAPSFATLGDVSLPHPFVQCVEVKSERTQSAIRHVTFSRGRELGQSPWSQQVLSTMFSPGWESHVTRAGCHICASTKPQPSTSPQAKIRGWLHLLLSLSVSHSLFLFGCIFLSLRAALLVLKHSKSKKILEDQQKQSTETPIICTCVVLKSTRL